MILNVQKTRLRLLASNLIFTVLCIWLASSFLVNLSVCLTWTGLVRRERDRPINNIRGQEKKRFCFAIFCLLMTDNLCAPEPGFLNIQDPLKFVRRTKLTAQHSPKSDLRTNIRPSQILKNPTPVLACWDAVVHSVGTMTCSTNPTKFVCFHDQSVHFTQIWVHFTLVYKKNWCFFLFRFWGDQFDISSEFLVQNYAKANKLRLTVCPVRLVCFLKYCFLFFCHAFLFFSILLTHEGSHREVYQDFQPSLTSSTCGAKGCTDHRFHAPPALSLIHI